MEQPKRSDLKSGIIYLLIAGVLFWFSHTLNKYINPNIKQPVDTSKYGITNKVAPENVSKENLNPDKIYSQNSTTGINETAKPVANLEDPKEGGTTLGQKLALIETDDAVFKSVDDPYVKILDYQLTLLSNKYHEPKDTIAEYTHKAQKSLKKDNVTMSAAELMNEVIITKRYKGTKYRDILFAYTVIYATGRK